MHVKLIRECLTLLGIDGLGDMKPICGTIAVEKKGKQGKEGKVGETRFNLFAFFALFSKIVY